MDSINNKKYLHILRILSGLTAIVIWVISVQFSVDGFKFETKEAGWIGLSLALCITILQLVWNHVGSGSGTTLFVAGVLSYMYGIFTNISGIIQAKGGIVDGSVLFVAKQLAFPIILGMFIEIVAEPLFLWAIIGNNTESDPLKHIFGDINKSTKIRHTPNRQQFNKGSGKRKYKRKKNKEENLFEKYNRIINAE